MTTIIRRYRRHRLAPPLIGVGAMLLLAALMAWLVMLVWRKGGPQPMHEIVIALPAPKVAPQHGGPRA